MLQPVFTNRFKNDYRRAEKRGCNIERLKAVMRRLINQEPLEEKHRDHPLRGNYKDRRECHVEPDWLLIYKVESEKIIFEKTGTHADLFK